MSILNIPQSTNTLLGKGLMANTPVASRPTSTQWSHPWLTLAGLLVLYNKTTPQTRQDGSRNLVEPSHYETWTLAVYCRQKKPADAIAELCEFM